MVASVTLAIFFIYHLLCIVINADIAITRSQLYIPVL